MALVRNRDISIDIMKCLAVILVMNSHMDLLYGKYSALATGGAIGDVLFFFASGYTILLGRGGNFSIGTNEELIEFILLYLPWQLYQPFYGRQRKHAICNTTWWRMVCHLYHDILCCFLVCQAFLYQSSFVFFAFCSVVVLIWYIFFFNDKERVWMYKGTYFKWCHYFLFMLLGAISGLRKK